MTFCQALYMYVLTDTVWPRKHVWKQVIEYFDFSIIKDINKQTNQVIGYQEAVTPGFQGFLIFFFSKRVVRYIVSSYIPIYYYFDTILSGVNALKNLSLQNRKVAHKRIVSNFVYLNSIELTKDERED